MLAYDQLWVASPLAQNLPRPWETRDKEQTTLPLSPSRVQRDFPRIVAQSASPTILPKPRGISPGAQEGTLRSPRPKQPVIIKSKASSKNGSRISTPTQKTPSKETLPGSRQTLQRSPQSVRSKSSDSDKKESDVPNSAPNSDTTTTLPQQKTNSILAVAMTSCFWAFLLGLTLLRNESFLSSPGKPFLSQFITFVCFNEDALHLKNNPYLLSQRTTSPVHFSLKTQGNLIIVTFETCF